MKLEAFLLALLSFLEEPPNACAISLSDTRIFSRKGKTLASIFSDDEKKKENLAEAKYF